MRSRQCRRRARRGKDHDRQRAPHEPQPPKPQASRLLAPCLGPPNRTRQETGLGSSSPSGRQCSTRRSMVRRQIPLPSPAHRTPSPPSWGKRRRVASPAKERIGGDALIHSWLCSILRAKWVSWSKNSEIYFKYVDEGRQTPPQTGVRFATCSRHRRRAGNVATLSPRLVQENCHESESACSRRRP